MNENYKNTLNLLGTDFPMRADAGNSDFLIQERWKQMDIDDVLNNMEIDDNLKSKIFVLHDGPPYANGQIHLGHAYNKILKDIVVRFRRMAGYRVNVTPGWDCHGLPIEQKVSSENPLVKGPELKKLCRLYANKWIENQKNDFKKLGISMNWKNPYVTMDPSYEAHTIEAFGKLVQKGFINRTNKTIPWCPKCQTALATAEIEYQEKKDPSIYVLFKMAEKYDLISNFLPLNDRDKPIYFLIWTTTPWTLPLNRAVMLKKNGKYLLVESEEKYIVIGKDTIEKLSLLMQKKITSIKEFIASDFEYIKIFHPLNNKKLVPLVFDNEVSTSEGTACVHTAPGCGPIDYEIGIKNDLEIYSPITDDGKYSNLIDIKELAGMSLEDGQIWVIKELSRIGSLFFKTSIKHSYPHCWRSKSPLIFRATPQWFFNLAHDNFKQKALNSLKEIVFYPSVGKNFLEATLSNRWEWCLSRQRAWGTPIIALISKDKKTYYTDPVFIQKIADKIRVHGIEYWDRVSLEELQLEGFLEKSINIFNYEKEKDILDVWFDSGVSQYACLKKNNQFPADLYLEGIDQYRGWFQSSLLLGFALEGKVPMRAIMTHGFTVDKEGRKMSKSLGNVVAPFDVTKKIGTDGLRIWVASIGNEGDAIISDTLLSNVSDVYRKIRNTCRFILQNISDFDLEINSVEFSYLHPFDLYALEKSYDIYVSSLHNYFNYNPTGVIHLLADFCSSFLSSQYFDSLKYTLYCDEKNNLRRRSAQTVLYKILEIMNTLISPIMPHTSELIFDFYKKNREDIEDSIHKKRFCFPINLEKIAPAFFLSSHIEILSEGLVQKAYNEFAIYKRENKTFSSWSWFWKLKDQVMQSIEKERAIKNFMHSSESRVAIKIGKISNNDWVFFKSLFKNEKELYGIMIDLFAVSEVFVEEISTEEENEILTSKHLGEKCQRCWRYYYNIKDICNKCFSIIT